MKLRKTAFVILLFCLCYLSMYGEASVEWLTENPPFRFTIFPSEKAPSLECIKGVIPVFSMVLEQYKPYEKVFIVDYRIAFSKNLEVKMNTDVRAHNFLNEDIPVATSGFYELSKINEQGCYYLKLVGFHFKDKITGDDHVISLYLPQTTYYQYTIVEKSNGTFLLQRKAEINSQLWDILNYRMGQDKYFFMNTIPDDFVCQIMTERKRSSYVSQSLSEDIILRLPWFN